MANGQKPKGGKKNRKWHRNQHRCAAYKARNQRERNKVRRLRNYLRRKPNDLIARKALARYEQIVRVPLAA